LWKRQNACPDAVQILTPCTVGNGWMRILNLGRYAVTLNDKFTGEGVARLGGPEQDAGLRRGGLLVHEAQDQGGPGQRAPVPADKEAGKTCAPWPTCAWKSATASTRAWVGWACAPSAARHTRTRWRNLPRLPGRGALW
jgi:hypothetical protein